MKRILASVFVAFLALSVQADLIRPDTDGGVGGGDGDTLPIVDTTAVVKGSVDDTKQLRFEVDGFTAGATRVITFQNLDATVALTATGGQTQTFNRIISNPGQGFYLGAESDTSNTIIQRTEDAPDLTFLSTGSLSNSWIHAETQDVTSSGYDNGPCLSAACVHPTDIWFGASPATGVYNAISLVGSFRRLPKVLTEGVATATLQIPVALEAGTGGTYYFTVYATDGATPQVAQGRVIFSVTNDGGVETCVLGTPELTDNTPTGTLTVAVTCATTPTNAVNLELNATSSLVQTTLEAYSSVDLIGPGQPITQ